MCKNKCVHKESIPVVALQQVLEMGDSLEVLMSEERVAHLCQEIDEWAAKKAKEDSMEVRGNLKVSYKIVGDATNARRQRRLLY